MSQPLVTVLIDTFNHQRFIERAISSVLAQDYPATHFEILVIDDGSTDKTPEIVRTFHGRVRYIRKDNGGQGSAFNVGVPEARGDVIAFLDGDDWWSPHKLSRIMQFLNSHPDIGVVGHGFYQVDTVAHKRIATSPGSYRELSFSSMVDTKYFRRVMCFFGTSRVTIRKNIAELALPIPSSIKIEADEFLSILSIANSRAALLPDILTFYRLHEDNLYQLRAIDPQKLRRLRGSIDALASELPPRLESSGVNPGMVRELVGTLEGASQQLALQLDGGSSFSTFALERAERRFHSYSAPIGYRLFSFLSLSLSLLIPPRSFYRLKRWYAHSRWRRWRSILGEPTPAVSITTIPESYQDTSCDDKSG
jgi:glycosyltransferase involved in cell wall biosynthesis